MCRDDFHAGCELGVANSAQASLRDPAPSVQTFHFGAGTNFSVTVIHAKLESLRKAAAMGKDAGKVNKIVLFFIKNAKNQVVSFGTSAGAKGTGAHSAHAVHRGFTIRAFLT